MSSQFYKKIIPFFDGRKGKRVCVWGGGEGIRKHPRKHNQELECFM